MTIIKRLTDLFPDIVTLGDVKDGKMKIVSGELQSGKTLSILACAWFINNVLKRNAIILLRNITSDRMQLSNRIANFNRDYIKKEQYYLTEGPKLSIALFNHHQLYNILNEFITKQAIGEFTILFDEADIGQQTEDETHQSEQLMSILLKRAHSVVGFTATCISCILNGKNIMNLSILPRKPNYVGIDSIDFRYVEEVDFAERKNPIPASMNGVYDEFLKKPFGIMLQSTDYLNDNQTLVAKHLLKKYKGRIVVITHNAGGITLYNTSKRYAPHKCKPLKGLFGINEHSFPSTFGISDALQLLRNEFCAVGGTVLREFHLAVISKRIAGRGLTYASNDFMWRITDQYYLPSKTVKGDTLLQGIRCCGLWTPTQHIPNNKVTMWLTKDVAIAILEQYHANTLISVRCAESGDNVIEKEGCSYKRIAMETMKEFDISGVCRFY